MEAIKCPNCGSEKVQELTEEKYVCLACDNVFLVHNLSKEFRQTDAHITDVHEDLNKKLDSINANLKMVNASGTDYTDNTRVREVLFEAEQIISEGKFLKSYVLFKKYAALMPDSYVGYEGMFRALTNDYKNDAGTNVSLTNQYNIYDCLLDGTDVIKRALECDDVDKEKILAKFEEFYNRSARTIKKKKDATNSKWENEEYMAAQEKVTNLIQEIEDLGRRKAKAERRSQLSNGKENAQSKKRIPFITTLLFGTEKQEKDYEIIIEKKMQELREANAQLDNLKPKEENVLKNKEDLEKLICNNKRKIKTAEELYQENLNDESKKISTHIGVCPLCGTSYESCIDVCPVCGYRF